MKKIFLFSIAFSFLFNIAFTAHAHQPKLIFDVKEIEVLEPEVSKAYYDELEGNPVDYLIDSEEDFNLYVNILVPDIEGVQTNYLVEIFEDESPLFTLYPDSQEWEKFYEPFGGDDYLMGPEFEQQVEAGEYSIKVSNPANSGKYVLAIGKKESFPFLESVKMIFTLPKLKTEFFEKSFFSVFYNLVGLFLLGFIIVVVGLIFVIYKIYARYRSKKGKKRKKI